MDKKGIQWKYMIGGIIAVIVLIVIIVIILNAFTPAKSPVEEKIEALKGLDYTQLTSDQKILLVKNQPDKITSDIGKWRNSTDKNKAEAELQEIVEIYKVISKTTRSGSDNNNYVDALLALSFVKYKSKNYLGSAQSAYESFKLYEELGFEWFHKEARKELLNDGVGDKPGIYYMLELSLIKYLIQGGDLSDVLDANQVNEKKYQDIKELVNKLNSVDMAEKDVGLKKLNEIKKWCSAKKSCNEIVNEYINSLK